MTDYQNLPWQEKVKVALVAKHGDMWIGNMSGESVSIDNVANEMVAYTYVTDSVGKKFVYDVGVFISYFHPKQKGM